MTENGNAGEINAGALASEIDTMTERIVNFRGNLAERALSAVDHATVADATERLHEAAQALKIAVEQTDVLQEYGGEESYYTVFELFCAGDQPGTAYSLEEIYAHLALKYDMGGESLDRLAQDMIDWTKDINDDAKKAGIQGLFISLDNNNKFVFAVPGHTMPASAETEPAPVEEIKEDEAEVEIAEEKEQPEENEPDTDTERELAPAEQAILDWFDEQLGHKKSLKQPYAVNELSSQLGIGRGEMSSIIDSLVERGLLFRQRTNPSHAPVLVRELPEENADVSDKEYAKKEVVKLSLTPELATEIVRVILDKVETYQQKVPTGYVYAELLESGVINKDVIITELNSLIRQMETMGILVVGTGKSRRKQIMQVGISSQEVRARLKQALVHNKLSEIMGRMIETSKQTDTN